MHEYEEVSIKRRKEKGKRINKLIYSDDFFVYLQVFNYPASTYIICVPNATLSPWPAVCNRKVTIHMMTIFKIPQKNLRFKHKTYF